MNARKLSIYMSAVAAAALFGISGAVAQNGSAITGVVTSPTGPMEGVLVTAKKDGARVAVTVVTDEKGRYSFPANRLEPGKYNLKIRATGYFASGRPTTDVAAGKSATADLKLMKTDNIAPQLTSAEWMLSMPGQDSQKAFLQDCQGCHSLTRVVTSAHTVESFMDVVPRMGTYSPGSQPHRPQKLLPGPRGQRGIADPTRVRQVSEYLASVNLSKDEVWKYPLQTLPRPTGKGTKVIITTYDLARPEAMPHDVHLVNGKAYYTDFGSQYIGELDLKTLKITDHPLPVMKAEQPKGVLELKPDRDGNIWASGMYQGGIYMLDTKSGQVKQYKLPDQYQDANTQESMVSPENHHVDGWVWTNNQQDHSVLRVNVKTGQWQSLGVLKDQLGQTIDGYDIPSDAQNNLWLLEFGGTGRKIGKIDAKTGKLTTWTSQHVRPRNRRGHFDANGVLWFAQYNANAVASFDPKTEKLTEYQMPFKWQLPYDAEIDAAGWVWNASMGTDRVVRTNPKTGENTVYMLPYYSNIRRVHVEKGTNTLWIGNNHGASIYKIEPLE
jgi:sugar lactone lactonase YvrE/5-hydroxyisourate hydrolase-like protein (transthyretin family)